MESRTPQTAGGLGLMPPKTTPRVPLAPGDRGDSGTPTSKKKPTVQQDRYRMPFSPGMTAVRERVLCQERRCSGFNVWKAMFSPIHTDLSSGSFFPSNLRLNLFRYRKLGHRSAEPNKGNKRDCASNKPIKQRIRVLHTRRTRRPG